MGIRTTAIAGFLGLAALTAFAQTPVPANKPAITVSTGMIGGFAMGGAGGIQSLKGLPYSAEEVTERVQTLADGTHITQTNQKAMMYRDSEGRIRNEHMIVPPPGAVMAVIPSFVTIMDPVAGFQYSLDSRNRIARRAPWPPGMQYNRAPDGSVTRGIVSSAPPPPPPPPPSAQFNARVAGSGSDVVGPNTGSDRPHPTTTSEPLGAQTIEGITAEGVRRTTTYPEGFMGNDRPITSVFETWTSPELKITLLSKMSDPRSGESTTKLTNISRADPDPSLFQVPADYTIEDEQQGPRPIMR